VPGFTTSDLFLRLCVSASTRPSFLAPVRHVPALAGTSGPRQVKMKPELVIAPVPIVRDFSADLGSWTGTAAE